MSRINFTTIANSAKLNIPAYCYMQFEDDGRVSTAIARSIAAANRAGKHHVRGEGASMDGSSADFTVTMTKRDGSVIGSVMFRAHRA